MHRLFTAYKSLTLSLLFIFLFSVTVSFAAPLYNTSNTTLDPQCTPSNPDCRVADQLNGNGLTIASGANPQLSVVSNLSLDRDSGGLIINGALDNKKGPGIEFYGRDFQRADTSIAGDLYLNFGGYQDQGSLVFRHYDNNLVSFTEDIRLSNTGNLGIGLANYTNSQYRLGVVNTTTNQTASNRVVDVSNLGATFNTTSGALTSYGGYFSSSSTRASGSNALTNVALYATATGAQNNYAAIFDQGNVGIGTNTPGRQLELTGQMYARNVADGDLSGSVFGKEYLYAFQKKMIDGGNPIVVLAGDSTTAGDAISDGNYLIQNLLKKIIIQSYHSVTIYNDAVSGTSTGQWRTTYLPAQIARNPDLMIIRYGINDGAINRTNFESDLRGGLALIRASRTVAQTACVVMTPSSTNDTPNGRDAAWYKIINPIMREAARDYQCTFIDTYATFYDSTNGGAWYDDPYGDGRHIHPKDALNLQIAGLIADVILPKTLASVVGSTSFENASSTFSLPNIADLPSTYSKGIRMSRTLISNGWAYDGQAVTFRQNDGIWLQFNNAYASGGLAWRTGQTSGFNAWEYPIIANANRNVTGSIGLGITPQEKLHIYGSVPLLRVDDSSSGSASFFGNNGSGSFSFNRNPSTGVFNDVSKNAAQIALTASTSGSQVLFYAGSTPNSLTSSDLKMSISENGRVGIGVAVPTLGKLQVTGSGDLLSFDAQSGAAQINAYNTDTNGLRIIQRGSNPLSLWTTATERVTVSAIGNVGIGITTPTGLLTLAGNRSASAWGTAGINFQTVAATYTDTSTAASATVTNSMVNSFGVPTLAATNTAVTYTNAATLYIAGAPVAGTNTTITNSLALNVASGNSYFAGNIGVGGLPTSSKFSVFGTTDLGLNATNVVRISNDTVSNILQSYVSGAVGRLVLNKDGGRVIVGGGTATTKANFQIAQSITANFTVANASVIQHGVEDNSKLTGTGTQNAYASYTASTQILDSTDWNHYAGFQTDAVIVGSPTIGDIRAFSSNVNLNGGGSPIVTNVYGMYILNPTMGTATVTNNYGLYVANLTGATNNYSIYTGTAKSYFGGFVGISNTTPGYLLHVGSASTTTGTTVTRFQNAGGTCDVIPSTSGGITCSSDYNLKKNIITLSNTPWVYQTNTTDPTTLSILQKVLLLQPVQYNWNVESDTDTKHAGFIAQDVQQLFPDLVSTDSTTGLLSLNYTGLLPYTIQALQDLNIKVAAIPELSDKTLYTAIATFLDGIANRGEAVVSKVKTKELCVDDVCVTKEQFKAMVEEAAQVPVTPQPPTETPTPETVTPATAEPIIEPESTPEEVVAPVSGDVTVDSGADTLSTETQ